MTHDRRIADGLILILTGLSHLIYIIGFMHSADADGRGRTRTDADILILFKKKKKIGIHISTGPLGSPPPPPQLANYMSTMHRYRDGSVQEQVTCNSIRFYRYRWIIE